MEIHSLKSKLVRLAHEEVELRPILIPMLSGKTASESSLLGQLVRAASEHELLRAHVLPLFREAKQSQKKFTSPAAAKNYHRKYRKKHPKTKKIWKDFFEPAKGKSEKKEEEHHEESISLPAALKGAPKAVVQAIAKAPEAVKKFITDSDHRKEKMSALGGKMKSSPKGFVKRIKEALKKEKAEIIGGIKAIGKLMTGKKLTSHDKKAMYAVGVYAAVSVLGGITAGLAGVGGAILHSFEYHIGFKTAAMAADELFTHYETGHSVVDLFGMLAGDEDPSDEAKLQALSEIMTVAVAEVLKRGLTDAEMTKILKGEKPAGMPDLKGLAE